MALCLGRGVQVIGATPWLDARLPSPRPAPVVAVSVAHAVLSPWPPGLSGILGDMLNDLPGFDRSRMAEVDRKTAAFFSRHLLTAGAGPGPGHAGAAAQP